MLVRKGTAAIVIVVLLSATVCGVSAAVATRGIQAELNGIVAVIPAGGPHNEMAMRSSRHWRKVRAIINTAKTTNERQMKQIQKQSYVFS